MNARKKLNKIPAFVQPGGFYKVSGSYLKEGVELIQASWLEKIEAAEKLPAIKYRRLLAG